MFNRKSCGSPVAEKPAFDRRCKPVSECIYTVGTYTPTSYTPKIMQQ